MQRRRAFIVGLAIIGVLLLLSVAKPGSATSSACLKCGDTNLSCTGSGANCCCTVSCQWVNTPSGGGLQCTCTNWCKKCGTCGSSDCTACTARNGLESHVRLASTAAPVEVSEPTDTFQYTAEAQAALAKKSLVAAQILRNLTTPCHGTPRAPLTLLAMSDAPFAGGTSRQMEGKPIEVTYYTGKITVVRGRAILDVRMLDKAEDDGGRPTGETLHVEVTERGQVIVEGAS